MTARLFACNEASCCFLVKEAKDLLVLATRDLGLRFNRSNFECGRKRKSRRKSISAWTKREKTRTHFASSRSSFHLHPTAVPRAVARIGKILWAPLYAIITRLQSDFIASFGQYNFPIDVTCLPLAAFRVIHSVRFLQSPCFATLHSSLKILERTWNEIVIKFFFGILLILAEFYSDLLNCSAIKNFYFAKCICNAKPKKYFLTFSSYEYWLTKNVQREKDALFLLRNS